MIFALAECGAVLSMTDRYGETPVFIAANEGKAAAVAALAECGAVLDTPRTEDGMLPMQAAARHGHRDVVELLHRKIVDNSCILKD